MRTVEPDRASSFIGPVLAPDLHLMTLNVRRPVPPWHPGGADQWANRLPLLERLLADERPSVLGLQEVMPRQLAEIADMLGPGYCSMGTGRNADRGGERCQVFIDAERLRFVDATCWWLSGRPHVPGSRSFGNAIPRVVVQVELEDLQLDCRFHVLVTHLDHISERSRRESARLLRKVTSSLGGPVVLMGDFNAGVDSAGYRELTRGGLLTDAWTKAATRLSPDWGTFSHYRPPRAGGRRLDWILVSSHARVESVGVNAVRYEGAAVSDHEAVQVRLRWDSETPDHREPTTWE